ncbi:MAG: site-2 protease family protein [Candidatus Dadabacteria bacterium]
MKDELQLFTIKGISIRLHLTFLVFVLWLIVNYFASGMHMQTLVWSLVFFVALVASFALHEYGHVLVASIFGITAKRITLYAAHGIPTLERLPRNPWQELLVSAAGPVISFLLASTLFLFSPQETTLASFNHYTGNLGPYNFVHTLGVANMALAVINLVPAFPLDGGRIFRALLAYRTNYLKATAIVASISQFIAFVLLMIGLFTMNLLVATLGLFILAYTSAEESYLKIRSLVKGLQMREVLMYDYDSINARLTVKEAANILESNHSKTFIVMQDQIPIGTLNRMEVVKSLAEQDYNKTVRDLMKEDLVPIAADMWVEDTLDTLSRHEDQLYPVFDQQTFLGVVNFQHIVEYLLIHKAVSNDYQKTKSLAELV